MASTAKSPTGDRPSFLGTRVPPTVETMAQYLRELDKDTFRKVLKAVVSALEGKDCRESVKMISETSALSEEQLSFIISGMYTLLREALRLPTSALKQEVFKEDLKDLRIPEDFIVDFVSLVFGNSLLARALQPSILMQLKLSDGTAHRFEVPVTKFHELRYNVALILKEMNDLEKKSILKIQD
ncbi:COMM domain-containing protein 5 isoform X3 [Rhinatrema bivittatum]|uniref:COMM domain-containing protein 5 isoform X3 n=1 Tax=Rhinatrema bivittatum TaxID=194408 RepID=UPI00112B9AE7|nr:COMM domain-containing protein 5 isoform X3 [Rhinatrema bivittatum]